MKKAIVIGGSNGIGLAIGIELIKKGYFLEILDLCEPEYSAFPSGLFRYEYCDLRDFNEDLIASYAIDPEVEVLMITAGIGRVADFEAHHISEIDKMMMVNATSTIKILRVFYERIRNDKDFYTGVMCSISGWLCTPAAAVYSAAKAATVRCIESVNIELEVAGVSNRILDVSPASFKGSRFYGGKNDLSLTQPLAKDVVDHLFSCDKLFIPQYDEIFKSVLERYHKDPNEYGLYSYKYKKDSGRIDDSKKVVIGYLSGTFDLFHVGHLNLLRRAKQHCDYLIVGVHDSGAWKGKETFIPLDERKEIVESCKYVDKVVDSCREDSDAWALWHYDKLFVGSDYKGSDRFMKYEEYFKGKGVEIVYFPYTKGTSSTQIRNTILQKTEVFQ